jgi:threonine synthase
VLGQAEDRAKTVASAIRIAAPAHADAVQEALTATGGTVVTLSDGEILEAWRALAHEEGVFCEPASAASVAAAARAGLEPGARVVCVITGHGLKDPETAVADAPPPIPVEPDPDSIAAAVERA